MVACCYKHYPFKLLIECQLYVLTCFMFKLKRFEMGFQMFDVSCRVKQILGHCKIKQELIDGCWNSNDV